MVCLSELSIVEGIEEAVKDVKEQGIEITQGKKIIQNVYGYLGKVYVTEFKSPAELKEYTIGCIDNKKRVKDNIWKGFDFWKKYKEEKDHYEYLKYGLIQKVNYNKFYHKEDFINSRKIYVHSEDCISSVQMLCKKTDVIMIVHMRSSDVKSLLVVDILGLYDILYSFILRNYKTTKHIEAEIKLIIGSAHYYIKNSPRGEN